MKVIVRFRKKGGGYDYVKARKTRAEGRELVFTGKEDEAKVWNTLYAATDFICKSGTRLEGVEIIQLEEKPKPKKNTSEPAKNNDRQGGA